MRIETKQILSRFSMLARLGPHYMGLHRWTSGQHQSVSISSSDSTTNRASSSLTRTHLPGTAVRRAHHESDGRHGRNRSEKTVKRLYRACTSATGGGAVAVGGGLTAAGVAAAATGSGVASGGAAAAESGDAARGECAARAAAGELAAGKTARPAEGPAGSCRHSRASAVAPSRTAADIEWVFLEIAFD